jgi:uncharacterized protein (TIRG00374 family)
VRLVAFVILFVLLAAAGIAWGVHHAGVTPGDLRVVGKLPTTTIAMLVCLCLAMYTTDMVRYRVFGRAVGEHVTWQAALDASVANFFFSWITPGAALGAPAAIVMLHRRGVSVEGATLIAFGKSLTGTAVLVLIAFAALALGYGPNLDRAAIVVLATGTGVLGAMLLVPIVGALAPRATTAGIDRVERWLSRRRAFAGPRGQRFVAQSGAALRRTVDKLAQLRRGGSAVPVALALSHIVYLAVLVTIAVVLAVSFGAPTGDAVGISIVYAAFTYVAPTPGGAGLSEAAATVFYGSVLPAHDAMLVVLLFRASTFYLHIVIGVVYLGIVGGARQIMERGKA